MSWTWSHGSITYWFENFVTGCLFRARSRSYCLAAAPSTLHGLGKQNEFELVLLDVAAWARITDEIEFVLSSAFPGGKPRKKRLTALFPGLQVCNESFLG
jgi:hypothetical protein